MQRPGEEAYVAASSGYPPTAQPAAPGMYQREEPKRYGPGPVEERPARGVGGVEGAGYGEGAGFGEGDTKMGSHYLDLFQHSTPWAAILAFVTVVATRDVHLTLGLFFAVCLLFAEMIFTLIFRSTGRLRTWPYMLNWIFFIPLLIWLILIWFGSAYLGYFFTWFYGSVFVLMLLSMVIMRPWAGDLLKDKTAPAHHGERWWSRLKWRLTTTWMLLFFVMACLTLIPLLAGGSTRTSENPGPYRIGGNVLNALFNYILPLWIAGLGIALTKYWLSRTYRRNILSVHGYGHGYKPRGVTGPGGV